MAATLTICRRALPAQAPDLGAGLHPVLQRVYAARGIRRSEELSCNLEQLAPVGSLAGTEAAAQLLLSHRQARPLIIGDFDADGATSTALMWRALRSWGFAAVDFLVPNRFEFGYGLTPEIVAVAAERAPSLIVTVDNGVSSNAGVAAARARGIDVLVTDHHLAGAVLPDANVIVNPNLPGSRFASGALAGVGVAFYVLLALRSELRARGLYEAAPQPKLDGLLDLVALGTVADVVKLDANNRRLVAQGLKRMRSGRVQPGIAALFTAAGRDSTQANAFDLGFALGPRINAAGRLSDMTLGIECLLTDDPARALQLAKQLDEINRERRVIEADMREQAELRLAELMQDPKLRGEPPAALAIFESDFHEGVVGIVASRLKDRVHRPTFVFAMGTDGHLKGSGRSIPGFHLRDALDLVSKRHPDLLRKFGGHAMAAGCTLEADGFEAFDAAFQQVATEWLDAAALTRTLRTDGPLPADAFHPAAVRELESQVWGQAFEAPVFCDAVTIVSQRIVGEKHLKLRVRQGGALRDAIWFSHVEPVGEQVRLAYRLSVDAYNGQERVQMVVEACEGV